MSTTNTTNNVNDFLFGGGGKSFPFDEIGDKVSGRILSVEMKQQTSVDDKNEPLYWNDGSPRMQLVIVLQTELGDGDEDDGQRRIYAKGGKFETAVGSGKAMKDAIADAVKAAGAKSIDEGAKLTVAFTGEGKKQSRGYSAPKLYTAKYEAAPKSVATDDLFD